MKNYRKEKYCLKGEILLERKKHRTKFNVDIDELSQMAAKDMTTQQMADHFGCPTEAIRQRLRDNEIPFKHNRKSHRKDLTGLVSGKLTVLSYSHTEKKKAYWFCICECGNKCIKSATNLSIKKVKSCGCLKGSPKGNKGNNWRGYGNIPKRTWMNLLSNADSRDIPVTLDIIYLDELFEEQRGICSLSGREIVLDKSHKINTASLDRIDSGKPYEKGNVQWVHKKVNIAKHATDEDEFIKMCYEVCEYSLFKLKNPDKYQTIVEQIREIVQ